VPGESRSPGHRTDPMGAWSSFRTMRRWLGGSDAVVISGRRRKQVPIGPPSPVSSVGVGAGRGDNREQARRMCTACGLLVPAVELRRHAVCVSCRAPGPQVPSRQQAGPEPRPRSAVRKRQTARGKPVAIPSSASETKRCPVCGHTGPREEFVPLGTWCLKCSKRVSAKTAKGKPKRRSVWTVSGGLPTLGKKRR
jgi:hypothetical protein